MSLDGISSTIIQALYIVHPSRVIRGKEKVLVRIRAILAPRIHTLLRLAERTGLAYNEEQRVFLARFDRYQIEGRYPDHLPSPPSQDVARAELTLAGDVFQWLTRQL